MNVKSSMKVASPSRHWDSAISHMSMLLINSNTGGSRSIVNIEPNNHASMTSLNCWYVKMFSSWMVTFKYTQTNHLCLSTNRVCHTLVMTYLMRHHVCVTLETWHTWCDTKCVSYSWHDLLDLTPRACHTRDMTYLMWHHVRLTLVTWHTWCDTTCVSHWRHDLFDVTPRVCHTHDKTYLMWHHVRVTLVHDMLDVTPRVCHTRDMTCLMWHHVRMTLVSHLACDVSSRSFVNTNSWTWKQDRRNKERIPKNKIE